MIISRRDIVKKSLLCGISSFSGLVVGPAPLRCDSSLNDYKTISDWMDAWMRKKDRDVTGPLHVSRFAEPIYFLLRPITWKPNPGQSGFNPVTAPVRFVTDFASIPRLFWSLLPPDGRYTYPAIIHDYLYWSQTTSKSDADEILRLAMEDFDIHKAVVTTIFEGVKFGGAAAWEENRKLREKGEKRILKKFPADPRTTWSSWKENPENFT